MHGVLVLDKSAGMSSAAAVEHVKRRLGAKRAGHGGTLDPLATGVLAVCLGEATKLAPYLLADDKAYDADLVLGSETDTLDRTGVVTRTCEWRHVTREMIVAALAARTGEQDQVPPMYSAIKQGGKRLYHLARAGEEVERAPRRIRIDRFELLAFDPPHVRVGIACSKGTYVRSLIADLGTDLGSGAHMTELRRTRSGVFTLAMARDLDHLDDPPIVPLPDATLLPRMEISPAQEKQVRNGVQLPVALPEGERFQLLTSAASLVAIAHVAAGKLVYDRVFVP